MTKKLDILLVSLPRSGSTMLSNLMTYNNSWCMVEPHNHENKTKSWIAKQARALGRHFKGCDFKNLAEQMTDFKKWGIKEIHQRHYIPVNNQLTPERYIILLRDPGEVFLSLKNFHYTAKDTRDKILETLIMWWQEIHQFAAFIPNDRTTIIYYDQLLMPEYRVRLGNYIDWPLIGQPDLWLKDYNRTNEARGNEIERRIHIQTRQDLDYMELAREKCKKVLLSTLLIASDSVMYTEDQS